MFTLIDNEEWYQIKGFIDYKYYLYLAACIVVGIAGAAFQYFMWVRTKPQSFALAEDNSEPIVSKDGFLVDGNTVTNHKIDDTVNEQSRVEAARTDI